MGVSYPTKLLLAFKNGNKCAFPSCCQDLIASFDGEQSVLGEAAHIAGEQPKSARYDSSMTEEERNAVSNLLYLCPTHHTQIDKQENSFTVERLLQIKKEHELKVQEGINRAFSEIGFPELAVAVSWISHSSLPGNSVVDLKLLCPDEKIKKNKLTIESRNLIIMGLCVASLVSDFVQQIALDDLDYPDQLKAGFLEEYFRLFKLGYRENDLFELMCEFSQRGLKKTSQQTAGLAVLIYLFEKCEVFEK